MKLLLIIIEGQIYLAATIAIFVAELAVLFLGVWSRRPIIGLIAVFATVPLIRSTIGAIRACFFRIRAPEGIPLSRTEGRTLYDLVEEIRCAVDAPAVDRITITRGFNAAAAVYSEPWRFRRHRTLVIGFPVLATLTKAELRAVIAHELAHFSSAHDGYAAWIYRIRRSWLALQAALDGRLATPVYVYWFIRWYIPRLSTASAEVARRHEIVADEVAVRVAGRAAAADALVAFESGARFAHETHWPAIETSYERAGEPPRPYSEMLGWTARIPSPDVLEELFGPATGPTDTHPSLRDRFNRLEETVRMPPSAVSSAGEELLGIEFRRIASRLDDEWITHNGESWNAHRIEYLDRRAALDRLTAIEVPTADELFKRGELIETLEGAEEALPFYQSAAKQGHPAASLAAGRVLLERMDADGIDLVERAMERDENLVPEACQVLAAYYKETNQELAARKCEWRATRHTTRARLAQGT